MSLTIFSRHGIAVLGDALAASEAYRKAAADWEGSLLLEARGDDEGGIVAVFLDLRHGDCRAARLAEAADRERADYIISAPRATWSKLFDGSLDPVTALFNGRLRLERGRILDLAPHLGAARQLIDVAVEVNRSTTQNEAPESDAVEIGSKSEDDLPSDETQRRANFPADSGRGRLQTTSGRGLDYSHPAMRLWTKAKRDGIWDPFAIDLERDRADWQGLDAVEREVVLHLTSQFQAGEESVARDLVPLLGALARDGALEEEIFLTSFLWEEAKHVELFHRFLGEVASDYGELDRFHGPAYRRIFYDELPQSLARLEDDPSPEALAEASVTYNMIVEGVLAETGYHAYHQMLEANELMPGMQRAIENLKRDESRHIAYGVFLLSRLVAEHGDELWEVVDRRMSVLLPVALESVRELFERYDHMPFGLDLEHFAGFATSQFERRYARIELARRQSLDEIYSTAGGR